MSRIRRGAARAVSVARSRSRLPETIGIGAFALILFAVLCQPLFAHGYKAGDIEVHHPWSRATPHGAKVAAGYVTIRNHGAEPDRLVSAAAEIAGRGEVHEMAVDAKGVMTMREVTGGVEIPAGGEVELKPGGLHLMFIELGLGATEGERFKGTLVFEKAGSVEVEYAVEAIGGPKGAPQAAPEGGSAHGAHGAHGG